MICIKKMILQFIALHIVFAALLSAAGAVHATAYYVSGNGNNQANGTSLQTAWRTLDHAVSIVKPGDRVNVGNGTYSPVNITCSGNSNAWIYFQQISGTTPHIIGITNEGSGINLVGQHYVDVSGFDISGLDTNNRPGYDVHGIDASGYCTHINIHNNTVHDCGNSGISSEGSDYIAINSNTVYGCCTNSPYNSSGITIYLMLWSPGDNSATHNYINYNQVYNNTIGTVYGGHTDGNGIAVDTSGYYDPTKASSQYGSSYDPTVWTPKTEVSGNNIWSNGGRAICITKYDSVTVKGNHVAYDLTDFAIEYYDNQREITAIDSHNCDFSNNPVGGMYAPDGLLYSSYHSGNMDFGGAPVYYP